MTGLGRVDLQPEDELVRGTRGSKPRPGGPEWSGSASRRVHRLAPVARGERPRSYRHLAIAGKGNLRYESKLRRKLVGLDLAAPCYALASYPERPPRDVFLDLCQRT